MISPKRVRMAYSGSFSEKSDNATKSSSPATTKNQGKSRVLISALRPRARALDRDLVGLVLRARSTFGDRLGLAIEALLEELVDREIDEVAPGTGVDDHLVRVREHALDGVGVEPPPRHLRRLRVSRLELREPRCLTLRDRAHLRLVRQRILLYAGGGALRHRQDPVAVRLGLELEALLVGLRLVGIALGRDHGIRHLHVLEVHRGDRDAGVVEVEHALNELLGATRDLGPRRADQELIEGAA